MSSRERVIRAMEFRCPDRLPFHHHVNIGSWTRHGRELEDIIRRYPGFPGESQEGPPGSLWAIEDDFAIIAPRTFKYGPVGTGKAQDEWGCIWNKVDPDVEAGHIEVHPLADWEDVANYRWPDALEHWRFDTPWIESVINWAREKGKFLVADDNTLFERAQALRGMEELLLDIMTEPERVCYILDRLLDHTLKNIQSFAKYKPDGVRLGDDWGTQTQLMIPPEKWRVLFKPYYKKMFDAVHDIGAKVWLHSDGYITEIIPDLIELGVDMLHIQTCLMDSDDPAKLVRGQVCLLAEPDRQWLLPHGTPEEVDQAIRRSIETLATSEGGLVAHFAVQPDVPLPNVEACYAAFTKHGNDILSTRRMESECSQ